MLDRSRLFRLAWSMARTAALAHRTSPRAEFAAALRHAWADTTTAINPMEDTMRENCATPPLDLAGMNRRALSNLIDAAIDELDRRDASTYDMEREEDHDQAEDVATWCAWIHRPTSATFDGPRDAVAVNPLDNAPLPVTPLFGEARHVS